MNQVLNYFDQNILIADIELEKGGRKIMKDMLINIFEKRGSHYQLIRVRQLLSQIFKYAEEENYIRPNQNPLRTKFEWEGLKHQKQDPKEKSFAHTLKG